MYINVILFHKRGLPHGHILIILADEDRPPCEEVMDSIMFAELLPDHEDSKDEDIQEQCK